MLYFKDPSATRQFPPLLNYDVITAPPLNTKSSITINCPCTICDLARTSGADYNEFKKKHSNSIGKPGSTDSPPAKTLAICTKCYSEVGKGKPHDCNKCS